MVTEERDLAATAWLEVLKKRYPSLSDCEPAVFDAYNLLRRTFDSGGKMLICGNGGSAADAEHISGELVKGFLKPRKLPSKWRLFFEDANDANWYLRLQMGLPAIPLSANGPLATAIVNDQGADLVFAQQVLSYGRNEDVLMAISTSGNSENIVIAVKVAKAIGMKVIGLTGADGGMIGKICDMVIRVPASQTFEIQELHLPIYHCLCAMLEEYYF